jgi:hypothetical protein
MSLSDANDEELSVLVGILSDNLTEFVKQRNCLPLQKTNCAVIALSPLKIFLGSGTA